MSLPPVIMFDCFEYSDGVLIPAQVPVSAEYHFTLAVNGSPVVSIACSGSDLEELTVGYLVSEGIITGVRDVTGIRIDEEGLRIDVTTVDDDAVLERLFRVHSVVSGCGQGRLDPVSPAKTRSQAEISLEPKEILDAVSWLLRSSDLHRETRGVHSAALFSMAGELLLSYDEIGRHNAVDKIVGAALGKGLPVNATMLVSTGRLSSEIVHKGVMAGIPAIVSKASPTSMAVELARKHGCLLVGKVRARAFVLFSGAEGLSGSRLSTRNRS